MVIVEFKFESWMKHLFSEEEYQLLNKYFHFYRSLDTGKKIPVSKAQKRFVEVCRGRKRPYTPHENAYMKYIGERDKRLLEIDKEQFLKKKCQGSAASVNKTLKNQNKAMKSRAILRKNVRDALVVFSDDD